MNDSLAFLGGGNMASALIGGLLQKGVAPDRIHVHDLDAATCARLHERFGISASADAPERLAAADILVLAVKPQQLRAAVAPLAGRLDHPLVVSIAAGVRLADLARWLGGQPRLVRAMPNTPALIGAGVTGLYAPAFVSAAERERAGALLGAVGSCVWVAEEAMLDAVTAISGSGPAYVFRFIEALEEAACAEGLPADVAAQLALATVQGAARLAHESELPPAVLRENVTSRGGTTAAALAVFEEGGLAPLVRRAVRAATARSVELGDALGKE